MTPHSEDLWARLDALNTIGIALSAEKDPQRLLELILVGAKRITHADGGTLYTLTAERTLELAIVRTDSLGIAMGGTTGNPVPFAPVPLYSNGEPNLHNVASCAVLQDRTINIPDAYAAASFDFSGTRDFDRETGYRSRSFLTVPLKDHEGDTIGVLQLINAQRPGSGEPAAFSEADERLAQSLASQAAVALSSQRLISDMKRLFDSIVRLIATAIDEKSPHTAGHCARVPELTMRLAEAAHRTRSGPLSGFQLSERDRYELEIASWLHDCGKLTTPEHIMEKSTKLETLFDRIALVDTRFEVLLRDARIEYLEARLALQDAPQADLQTLERTYRERVAALEGDRTFIRRCNIGSEEPMSESDQERVRAIGAYRWTGPEGAEIDFLTEDEIANLTIRRGTLTEDERQVIKNHIVVTIKMLESLPFPKHLARVPEIAGGHHERVDGRGYPRGLTKSQMSVQARAMAIADVFEALTDGSRPYKRELRLSEALTILGKMSLTGHIDPDLFQIFVRDRIYLDYARRFLAPEQIDAVNEFEIPGYYPAPPGEALQSGRRPAAGPGVLRPCPG